MREAILALRFPFRIKMSAQLFPVATGRNAQFLATVTEAVMLGIFQLLGEVVIGPENCPVRL